MHNFNQEVEEILETINFIYKLKEKADFKELEYSKQKRNLEKIKTMIQTSSIISFDEQAYKLKKEEVHKLLREILISFMTKEEIEQNINLIKISPNLISSVEDCVTKKKSNNRRSSRNSHFWI
jgi:ABC-type branched-subunit amino acid transport system ATPase component